MVRIWRNLLILVAAPVVAAVLAQIVLVMIERAGWLNAQVPVLGPMLDWIRASIGETAYPWVAGITIGTALGMILWRWAAAADTRLTRQRIVKLRRIGTRMQEIADRISLPAGANRPKAKSDHILEEVLPELIALDAELKPLRIGLPETPDGADAAEYIRTYRTYLNMLAPAVQGGHLKEARNAAREMKKAFKASES